MRLGLWGARADRRGLAIQAGEFARHMRPDRVMGFDLTVEDRSPYPCDWRDYDGLDLTVRSPLTLTEAEAKAWLRGLDVVWGAETFYHDDFPTWAREVGVATVLHCNPEFARWWADPTLPRPDVLLAPSRWRLDRMPGVEHLHFPVARDRCAYTARPLVGDDEPLTFLHIAGHRAMHDRNGTSTVLAALARTKVPCRVLIRSQSPMRAMPDGLRGAADVRVVTEDAPDYWAAYRDADVLLFPRRYGGQALPINEALSCGLPVISTDVDPQRDWIPPATLLPARVRKRFATQAGYIDCYDAHPAALAETMDELSSDRDLVRVLSAKADGVASGLSWEALKPRYVEVLQRAAGR